MEGEEDEIETGENSKGGRKKRFG